MHWFLLLVLIMLTAAPCPAKTLVIAGRLSSEVTVTQLVSFGVDGRLSELTYRFPVPAKVAAPSLSQRVSGHRLSFDPEPVSVEDETDSYGNSYKVVTWRKLQQDARATIVFTAAIEATLDSLAARAPFPPTGLPEEARPYLKPSRLVQSQDPEVTAKAAELTAAAASEAAAVDAIVNFVADHIRYETPPKSYDALFGLSSGTGNCQNFAHLACALLRASGIPARVAVGLTLKDKWKIPVDDHGSSIVQGMGGGLHAWIEVFYPGLGWLPYDPQQSKQFTSTRHIKYAHGPDCSVIGTSWRGSPAAPRYDSAISSNFSKDLIELGLMRSGAEPRGYIASSEIIAAAGELTSLQDQPPPSGPKPVPEPRRPKAVIERRRTAPAPPVKAGGDKHRVVKVPGKEGLVEFGNLSFPANLALYTTTGERGEAALEQETAEYVTSSGVYAQAFVLDRPLSLQTISLAMKKFGGDGMLYVDLVADEDGKPGLSSGIRSGLLPLERVRKSPGYGWVDFQISAPKPLPAGKYWIVLRRSGEAIVNWYYTPGKPYGGPHDTRSTSRGWHWEDILTYDFVFKVTGRALGEAG